MDGHDDRVRRWMILMFSVALAAGIAFTFYAQWAIVHNNRAEIAALQHEAATRERDDQAAIHTVRLAFVANCRAGNLDQVVLRSLLRQLYVHQRISVYTYRRLSKTIPVRHCKQEVKGLP